MTDNDIITLEDLCGNHTLDGCDYAHGVISDEGANAIRFRLDGVVYTATEDPCDDYRSCLDKIYVGPKDEISNVFPPIKVTARMQDTQGSDGKDVLELIDIVTRKVVLEVGTDNTEDYYPSFVAAFHPENMITNNKIDKEY